jgi:hypothetical protein
MADGSIIPENGSTFLSNLLTLNLFLLAIMTFGNKFESCHPDTENQALSSNVKCFFLFP